MENLEKRFVELWNAGVKFSDIEKELNIDYNAMGRLRRKTKVNPRRNEEAQKIIRENVWDMVNKRIPVNIIAQKMKVSKVYVYKIINKHGYSVWDFYQRPKRKKKQETPIEPGKIKCTPSVMNKCIYGTHDCCMYICIEQHRRPCSPDACTCFHRRPKGFKQRSF